MDTSIAWTLVKIHINNEDTWLTQSHEKKCINQRLDILRFEPVPLFSAKSGNKKNRNGNEASRLSFKTRKPCHLTP